MLLKVWKSLEMSSFIFFLLCSFVAILILSAITPVLFPIDLGETHLSKRLLPPMFMEKGSPEHWLGTDYLGRDFLIRLLYGTKNSLVIAISGLAISVVVGTFLGVIAGFYRGIADMLISFLIDVRLSIPSIIIAIICAATFGASKGTMILIIGFTGFASFARLIRGQTIQLKDASFIECSISMGASKMRIVWEHVLINISSQLIINATMRLSSFILLESSLSFLGLGIQPPDVSLGVMVSNGRDHMLTSWWLAIIPSFIIVLIVFQVSMLGDWLRDRLDPKLKD